MATKRQGEIDVSITKIECAHAINSGVWLGSTVAGLVPVYEEQIARLERGISMDDWSKMDVNEKAMVIAVRRVSMAMANLQAEAEIEKTERKK